MPRVFFTGRRKIRRSDVSIILRHGKPSDFQATIDLSKYAKSLTATASVIVEASHTAASQRFDFGTVADCRPRAPLLLTIFDEAAEPRFRVLVVDNSSEPGVLLAACDSVNAIEASQGASGGRSLLQLVPKPNSTMRGQLWKVAPIGGGFQLWYNRDIPRLASAIKGKNPETLGLILPSAIREILARLHVWDEVDVERNEWTDLAEKVGGERRAVSA